MEITIMDILKAADYNLGQDRMMEPVAREQLHNAITLLDQGYDLYDTVDVDALAAKYGSLEDVPEKGE